MKGTIGAAGFGDVDYTLTTPGENAGGARLQVSAERNRPLIVHRGTQRTYPLQTAVKACEGEQFPIADQNDSLDPRL